MLKKVEGGARALIEQKAYPEVQNINLYLHIFFCILTIYALLRLYFL